MPYKVYATLPVLMVAAMLASPAAAHDRRDDTKSSAELRQIADNLSDPRMQRDMSNVVEAVTGAVLNLPVGEFAETIERTRPGTVNPDINRDTRLGDLTGPDGDRIPARAGDGARASMAAMGDMMRAFSDMLPELQKLGREIEDSVDKVRDRR